MPGTRPAIELLGGERARVEGALGRVLGRWLPRIDGTLAAPIRYAVEAGGKRLRPILCMAAYRASGGGTTADPVYDAACALELIHTYSLMHDDLPCMDDDEYRRGRPAAHTVYGEAPVVLAGAVMIPLAFAVLGEAGAAAGLASGTIRAALADLARGADAAGMVGGQVLDLEAEGHAIDAAGLENVHVRKTGALISASLRIGGRFAGADETVLEALSDCGRHLGLAFQVTDDVLDVTGDAEVLGKTAGSDAAHGKATYPALLGLEGARAMADREADAATRALRSAGIHDELLEGLIAFAVSRDR